MGRGTWSVVRSASGVAGGESGGGVGFEAGEVGGDGPAFEGEGVLEVEFVVDGVDGGVHGVGGVIVAGGEEGAGADLEGGAAGEGAGVIAECGEGGFGGVEGAVGAILVESPACGEAVDFALEWRAELGNLVGEAGDDSFDFPVAGRGVGFAEAWGEAGASEEGLGAGEVESTLDGGDGVEVGGVEVFGEDVEFDEGDFGLAAGDVDAGELAGQPDIVPAVWGAVGEGEASLDAFVSGANSAPGEEDWDGERVGVESGVSVEAVKVSDAVGEGDGVVESAGVSVQSSAFELNVEFEEVGVILVRFAEVAGAVEVVAGAVEMTSAASELGAAELDEGGAVRGVDA